ncbi:MAG TPA: glycosyltransferase family 4 protein, partial [Rhodocyclaceae bacterium]
MRICFYNLTAGFKSGGLETYCWEVGRALARNGHEVTLIAGTGGRARNAEVRLVALPYVPRDRFPDLGTRFRKLAERLSFARHAMPHLLSGGFDAVVINKPYDFPALWYARRHGFGGVVALRSGGTEHYLGDRYFGRAVDLWLSTSAYNAAQVKQRYRHDVTVVPNGVDPALFRPAEPDARVRQRFGIPAEARLAVSVGRLVGWKGLHTVIEALAGIPGMHYLAVGHGPERDALMKLAARLGVGGRVHFAGEAAHADLPVLLNAADLFVQPSIGEEAFGISVVEAMACGLPALVADQGGLREIVRDGECGRLLPPDNVPAWRKALGDLDRHPGEMQRLGAAARRRAEQNFTWDANARRLAELLE